MTRPGLVWIVGLLLAPLGVPAGAAAPPQTQWKPLSVAVLPIDYYGHAPDDLFSERAEVRRIRAQAARWRRTIEDALAGLDNVTLVRAPQVRERLRRSRGFDRTAAQARDRFDLGVRAYDKLAHADALAHFRQATVLWDSVSGTIAAPEEMADAAIYEGLILAEQSEWDAALIAFRTALWHDPSRRFERGYYPSATEKRIGSAQKAIASQPDKLAARYALHGLNTLQQMAALARGLEVDGLIAAVIDGPPEAPILTLALYETDGAGFTANLRVPLTDPAAAARSLDRTLSAWHTCAVVASAVRRTPPRPEWFVDLSYVHGIWLAHRQTRDALQLAGGQLTVTYEPSASLHFFGRASNVVTLSDDKGDLIDSFSTTRLTVGAGLSAGTRTARFFGRMGLDLGFALNDIEMTTDVDCKHFGRDHPRCANFFTERAPSVWLGLDFALGGRIGFGDSFFITVEGGVSSYVADPAVTAVVNFPLRGSLGFGTAL